jgi:hypothetical protein
MKLDRLKMHQEWFDKNQHLIFLEARIVMQELLAMTREARNQRDEARRMWCESEPVGNCLSVDDMNQRARAEAKRRGWGCFKENTNYLQDLG